MFVFPWLEIGFSLFHLMHIVHNLEFACSGNCAILKVYFYKVEVSYYMDLRVRKIKSQELQNSWRYRFLLDTYYVNFVKFLGKHFQWRLLSVKVEDWSTTSWNKDSIICFPESFATFCISVIFQNTNWRLILEL